MVRGSALNSAIVRSISLGLCGSPSRCSNPRISSSSNAPLWSVSVSLNRSSILSISRWSETSRRARDIRALYSKNPGMISTYTTHIAWPTICSSEYSSFRHEIPQSTDRTLCASTSAAPSFMCPLVSGEKVSTQTSTSMAARVTGVKLNKNEFSTAR